MMGPMGMRPGIILLREGTDTSQVSGIRTVFGGVRSRSSHVEIEKDLDGRR